MTCRRDESQIILQHQLHVNVRFCVRCHQYRFNHGFCLIVAYGDVVDLVLLTEVGHHLVRGIKHLTEVAEESEAPAAKWQVWALELELQLASTVTWPIIDRCWIGRKTNLGKKTSRNVSFNEGKFLEGVSSHLKDSMSRDGWCRQFESGGQTEFTFKFWLSRTWRSEQKQTSQRQKCAHIILIDF